MKKLIISLLLSLGLVANVHAADPKDGGTQMSKEMMAAMVTQSMQMFKVEDDVSFDDAVQSMQLRANTLNFKMVADLPLSDQVKSMGAEANPMRILAFCDALIANEMVKYNKIFAGFLPCRIAIVTDNDGSNWIITMNMDMMLNAVELTPELEKLAKQVRDTIYSIVDAGVNGDL